MLRRSLLSAIVVLPFATVPAGGQTAGAGCAAVAAVIGDAAGPVTLVRDTVVRDPRTETLAPGCMVRLDGRMSAFVQGETADQLVRRGLHALGWREDLSYAADGPDGTAFAMRTIGTVCFARAEWDGGDDTDPAYVPADRYVLDVGCTAAPGS